MNLISSLEPMQTRATCLLPAKRPSLQFIRFGFVSDRRQSPGAFGWLPLSLMQPSRYCAATKVGMIARNSQA
jgi:hypothetical protein